MTDRELEIIYVAGCVESQAEGLRRVFVAGLTAGKNAERDNWHEQYEAMKEIPVLGETKKKGRK